MDTGDALGKMKGYASLDRHQARCDRGMSSNHLFIAKRGASCEILAKDRQNNNFRSSMMDGVQ